MENVIEFSRKESRVIADCDCGVSTKKSSGVFMFGFSFEHDTTAEVMRRVFQKHLDETMKAIREQAYNQGWKDAKSKAKKKTIFVDRACVTEVCGS